MTVTQINYFLTVTEQGSFSAAAARLFVSQPAVSKQVSMLEADLGFRLFDRADRRIQLTENGRRMYDTLRRCVDDVEALVDDIRCKNVTFNDELRVGCVELWNASLFFNPLLEHFSKNHAGVRLSVDAYSPAELVEALHRREIDIALSYDLSFAGKKELFPVYIKTLECGLLYSLKHFQPREGQGAHAFDGVPVLIGDEEDNVFPRMSEHVFESYGLRVQKQYGRRMNSIVMDAFCGHGVMLVTEWNQLVGNASFGYLPIGREFPVSAAYMRGEITGQKLFLINDVVWTLKKT